MRTDSMKAFTAVFACFVALASATHAHASDFTIGGTVSGLNSGASVTLLDNGGDSLKVTANGKFTFSTALATGAAYKVTVGTQPTGETCTVTAGSGTVGTKDVTTVKVTCKAYTIGGTVAGLSTGNSVTLLDNGTDSIKVLANGKFTFPTTFASGTTYDVTVSTQPTGETCTVTGGSGTIGTVNVTTVKVTCKAYTIGGTVSGLSTSNSVTLLDNGTDSIKVLANGKFTFPTTFASGTTYDVTVGTQPTGETCTVTGGSGTIGTINVTTIKVTCKAYTVGGTVSGLTTGNTVTLLDNGTDSIKVLANGKFTFPTTFASGATYDVTVGTQPTGETCTVTGGSGTVGTIDVTTIKVACKASTTTFSIGGKVSGLNSSTSVILLDNGGDADKVSANGGFTFTTKLASGATYNVTVGTEPTGETCTVTNGSGTVGTANVTNVAVACTTAATFTIGGTVSGLKASTSVTLLDNGGDPDTVSTNGSFVFSTALATGTTYSVTVGTEPTGETCTVSNGSGTVGTADVTNVAVVCSSNSGGGGAYWIPYSAAPIPGATPTGSNGLFLIASDQLSSGPAPKFLTNDTTQLLGIGTQISVSGGTVTYSPQVMMYADTNSSGVTSIFGVTLANTSSFPTPAQISSLALPSGQQICEIGFSALTDITEPTTLFVVIEVGTTTQCTAGTGTYEVVHYLDSASTAPFVVSINTTDIQSVYQNGKLVGLLLVDSTTNTFNLYKDDTFSSPTSELTSVSSANYISGVLDEATLSTSGLFFSVTTTAAVTELYRIDGATLAATLIQNLAAGSIANETQDDNNLYYMVFTAGTGATTIATFNQVALGGGTPELLYTAPSFTETSAVNGYQLIGSNDSVLAFEFYSEPFTDGIEDPTKATGTIYTIPVGTATTTPTKLASYPAGNQIYTAFLSTPSGSGLSSSLLFATVRNATGSISAPTIKYSAVTLPLNGATAPPAITNSIYSPLAVNIPRLSDSVWQVTGITDANGGYGGGTANSVNVSSLVDTPFTTVGGGDYVFPAGFVGDLFAISSNNIALGFFDNAPAVISGTAKLQEDGAAADLTKNFLYVVSLPNTYIAPY